MVVISTQKYNEIIEYLKKYNGLSAQCSIDLGKMFPEFESTTLVSILSNWERRNTKINVPKIRNQSKKLVKMFDKLAAETYSDRILIDFSITHQVPPVSMVRVILNEKYPDALKSELSEMLKNPYVINDPILAANVANCIYCDDKDGPLTNTLRRCVGGVWEEETKKCAKECGMLFYDEADLKRTGFDKTPDLKLVVPCLYRGKVINWIESKGIFGDIRTHRQYMQDQFQSYGNRFGVGLAIYWFGYVEEVDACPENKDVCIVLDKFPDKSDLEFLSFENTEKLS